MVQIKRDWFDAEFGNYERGRTFRKDEKSNGTDKKRLV